MHERGVIINLLNQTIPGSDAGAAVILYIGCAILATILFGMAALFLKIGVTRDFPEMTFTAFFKNFSEVIIGLLRNWIWLLGLVLNIVGGLFYFVAIAKIDISIVKPIITLYVVIASLLGVIILKETLSKGEIMGIIIAICGALMLAVYGEADTGAGSLGPVQFKYLNVILAGDILLSGMILLPLAFKNRPEFLAREILISIFSGLNWGLGAVYFKVFYMEITTSVLMIGNPDYISTAFIFNLIVYLLTSWTFWWMLALNIVGFAVYQMAFSSGRMAIVAPIVMISTLFGPIVAGKTIFGEALPALKMVGITFAAIGTAVIAMQRSQAQES